MSDTIPNTKGPDPAPTETVPAPAKDFKDKEFNSSSDTYTSESHEMSPPITGKGQTSFDRNFDLDDDQLDKTVDTVRAPVRQTFWGLLLRSVLIIMNFHLF